MYVVREYPDKGYVLHGEKKKKKCYEYILKRENQTCKPVHIPILHLDTPKKHRKIYT